MMNTETLNLNSRAAVRTVGMQALMHALGPVGMARFLQQTEDGHGDYTKEKHSTPEPTWEELRADLKRLDTLPG
ncbi:MAG: hypothetical protein IKZ87_04990 [Actinomycetaceae bacterium]|nr:hypothetical protein [Actinomycetaceae bacterium]